LRRGNLFILSGASGAGKGTLRKKLFEGVPDMAFSVSCTTRNIRPGEHDGEDYHFISKSDFEARIADGEFLEWAEVHGNYYGTRQRDVERVLEEGRDILLEIDVQGHRQVKLRAPEAVSIFITAPSLDEIEIRLEDRGTETQEQRDLRLRNAAKEMRYARDYDHVIVNDDMQRASGELIGLVKKFREEMQ